MKGCLWAFAVGWGLAIEPVGGFQHLSSSHRLRPHGPGGLGGGSKGSEKGFMKPKVPPGVGRSWIGGLPPSQFRLETDELLPITVGRNPPLGDTLLGTWFTRADVSHLGPLIPHSSSLLSDEADFLARGFPSITSPSPPSAPNPTDQLPPNRNNNFTVNVGKALDALRLDVPLCFEKEPELSIYTEDVRFRDNSRVYANGKFMYQMLFFSLRLARVFMPMPPIVDVLNMRWCEARQCIYVRFQIRVDTLSDQLYYDAVSLYRVNSEGLIYEHVIENVIRNDIMEKPSMLSLLYTTREILIAPGGPTPAPDSVGC